MDNVTSPLNGVGEFRDYNKEQPAKVGLYAWRVEHKALEGLAVTFIAKFRRRGAGHRDVLSPEFDYWDGYRVHIPKNIEWAEYAGDEPKSGRETLDVNGLKNSKCPFCDTEPEFTYSGAFVCAGPLDSKDWSLSCCGSIRHATRVDPRVLSRQWNLKISRIKANPEISDDARGNKYWQARNLAQRPGWIPAQVCLEKEYRHLSGTIGPGLFDCDSTEGGVVRLKMGRRLSAISGHNFIVTKWKKNEDANAEN